MVHVVKFCQNSREATRPWSSFPLIDKRYSFLSVCNRCVLEVFGGVFVLSCCFLDFSVSVGAFIIGLSQISSFFSSEL